MDIDVLIARYPRLYHMAEAGSWPNIQQHGLLSTAAILDSHGIQGAARRPYESTHRPEKMALHSAGIGTTIFRDQKPMSDARLKMCLGNGLTPQEWYFILNQKVFFWVSHKRLLRLLGAREYRHDEHDVLTLDTEGLVRRYCASISLCHMNSGNTWPYPHARDETIFSRIDQYPIRARTGGPAKEVVELVVDYAVPNIPDYVISAKRMKGPEVISNIYEWQS